MSRKPQSEQWADLLGVDHMTATPFEILRKFEREVIPLLLPQESSGLPFYAVPLSALPPGPLHDASRHCSGWFHPRLYYWVRAYLQDDRGPGGAFIVDDQPYALNEARRLELADDVRESRQRRGQHFSIAEIMECIPQCIMPERILATAIHELGHVVLSISHGHLQDTLELCQLIESEPQLDHRRIIDRRLHQFADEQRQRGEPQDSRLLAGHGPEFVRAVAHLDHRLRRFGVHGLPPIQSRFYGHKPFSHCRNLLARSGDFQRRRGQSLVTLLRTPTPRRFNEATRTRKPRISLAA